MIQFKKLFSTLLLIWASSVIIAQSDVFRIVGGSLEEGQSAQFPIYFTDVSGSGIDTGDLNIGSFSIEVIVPAGLLVDASIQRAGVIGTHPILIEGDLTDLSVNKIAWYIAFVPGNAPFFNLDAPAPGELIAYLNLTAETGTAGSLLTMTTSPANTYIQDEFGNFTNSVENGKLIADFQNINLVSAGGGSAPQIAGFSVSPSQIQTGGTADLSWTVTDADSVTIDQGIGTVASSGSQSVSPTITTTYTLSATNQHGTNTAQTTLTVSQLALPVIDSFTATPSSIQQGSSSTLNWSVTGSDSVSIDQGIGSVSAGSGSQPVSPSASTTYTLSATYQAGTVTAQVTVTVTSVGLPVISSFIATPSSIQQGESSTLSWDVTGADTITIDQGIGSVASSGSRSVTPSATTVYRLTALNTAGSVTSSVTVSVSVPQGKPTISSFYADPDNPEEGTDYTVIWAVDGGTATTTLTLETHDATFSGITELQGSRVFTADTSRTFILTAVNSYGSDQQAINVEVQGVFEVVTFEADRNPVFKGQDVTLSWFVTGADQVHIEPVVGIVSGEGQQTVTVDAAITYTLIANRGAEEKTAELYLELLDLEEGDFLYFPLVRDNSEWFTELGIVNLAPVQTRFDVYYFDQEGSLVDFFTNKRLAPYESMHFVFNEQSQSDGWVKVWNRNQDIGSVGLFGWGNLKTHDGAQLVAYTASRITSETLLVPHLAKDTSFYTLGSTVSGINGGETNFNSSDQSYLIGNLAESQAATWNFRDLMSGDLGSEGWGQLTGDAVLEQKLVGLELFGREQHTGLSQAVGITLDSETSEELVFTHIAKDVNQFWTGCVAINPNQNSVNLEIQVFNDEGEELEGPAPEILGPGAKKTILVDKNRNDLAPGTSWAIFKSSEPIFGYLLFGSYTPDDRFSGFQSVKSSSRTLCFPDTDMSMVDGGWTGLALVNNNQLENQVRLVLISESGEEKGVFEMTLAPRKKFIGLVSTIFQAQTLEKGDKVMAFGSLPIAGFELYGKNKETLGGILAFSWEFE